MTDLPTILNRRAFLGTAGNSFGAAALTAMMAKGDTSTSPHPKAFNSVQLMHWYDPELSVLIPSMVP